VDTCVTVGAGCEVLVCGTVPQAVIKIKMNEVRKSFFMVSGHTKTLTSNLPARCGLKSCLNTWKPCGLMSESALADFHGLREGLRSVPCRILFHHSSIIQKLNRRLVFSTFPHQREKPNPAFTDPKVCGGKGHV